MKKPVKNDPNACMQIRKRSPKKDNSEGSATLNQLVKIPSNRTKSMPPIIKPTVNARRFLFMVDS
jgi:hypothetical protein